MDVAFRSPIFKELTNAKQKYVQIPYTELDTVKSANESSFTARSEIRFHCVECHETHNYSINLDDIYIECSPHRLPHVEKSDSIQFTTLNNVRLSLNTFA
jgi:hypothetical protein